MTIGQRIALKRKELGLSQENLGEKLGVSRQSVYKWESDAAVPEIDKLIAMSRLFAVTVGWLLGVEETERAEVREGRHGGAELDDAQLRMVEEIVGRYMAAQHPTKKKRWLRVLAAVAAGVLIWVLSDISGELRVLYSRYDNLQSSISHMNSNVNSQINGIADRVEEILESQNSLLADYSVEIAGADLLANTVTLRAMAAPKTYVEGMEALFLVDTGAGPQEYPAEERSGRQFAADITCELTDTTVVSVVFVSGETRHTQVLYNREGLYSASFPYVCADGHHLLFWKDMDENGDLRFSNEYVWLQEEQMAPFDVSVPTAEIRELKVGLFKNRELVAWLEKMDGVPENYRGFQDHQFYRVPDMTLPVSAEDIFSVGTLVIDEYGREKLYSELGYALDEEDEELTTADDRIIGKEDWYDAGSWKY